MTCLRNAVCIHSLNTNCCCRNVVAVAAVKKEKSGFGLKAKGFAKVAMNRAKKVAGAAAKTIDEVSVR